MVTKWLWIVKKNRWGGDRDFWSGQPSESGNKGPDSVPAFRSFPNKIMAYLLDLPGHLKGHGIVPHSLKVTTIPALPLMAEAVKGNANSPQLSTRWNYRAATSHGIDKIYSRETSRSRNCPCLIFPNPRSAHTMYQSLLKPTHRSFRGA